VNAKLAKYNLTLDQVSFTKAISDLEQQEKSFKNNQEQLVEKAYKRHIMQSPKNELPYLVIKKLLKKKIP